MPTKSTASRADPPAKPSQPKANEAVLTTLADASCSPLWAWLVTHGCLGRSRKQRSRPLWARHVPGVLNQDHGRAFAEFLALLTGGPVQVPSHGWKTFGLAAPCTPDDYGVCWRVLDAQVARVDRYPRALPQRHRRV